jgi:methionine-rich copper-binding protein CopC
VASAMLALLAVLAACAPVAGNRSANGDGADAAELLLRSAPADGASMSTPQILSLTFEQPVRLAEVTISGPSGEMPMMITAAGLQTAYSIPLPDLEPGPQQVRWRALTQDGVSHEGRLSFTVR